MSLMYTLVFVDVNAGNCRVTEAFIFVTWRHLVNPLNAGVQLDRGDLESRRRKAKLDQLGSIVVQLLLLLHSLDGCEVL